MNLARAAHLIAFALTSLLSAGTAKADATTSAQEVEALVASAQTAEDAFDFASAYATYERLIASGVSLPRVVRRRHAYLEARREGGFAPLVALTRFQRSPDSRTRSADVQRFEASVRAFPRGRVRLDAHAAIVQAYLAAGDEERAIENAIRWRGLPEADADERDQATRAHSAALFRAGRPAEAADIVAETSAGGTAVEDRLRSRARTTVGTPVAYGVIALFGAWIVVGLVRTRLRALRALRISSLLALMVASLGPLLIATRYDLDASDTFATLGAATFGIGLGGFVLGGALSLQGAPRGARLGASVLAACSMLCAAYIVLASNEGVISYLP